MTEAAWLSCTDPKPMLEYLRGEASDRKLRLVRVAAARLLWDRLHSDTLRAAVEAAEAHADGRISATELRGHNLSVFRLHRATGVPGRPEEILHLVFVCTAAEMSRSGHGVWLSPFREVLGPRLTAVLRCVFGNPFRPVPPDSECLTPTVTALAAAIYEDRAFDRMPVLADALEEAGCDNADILAHCRSDGPHVRGCWVIDLVLGKA